MMDELTRRLRDLMKPIANWPKGSRQGWPMSIHFPKKSQERSQEVHAYEDENFGTTSQSPN